MKTASVIVILIVGLLASCARNELLAPEPVNMLVSEEIPRDGLAGEWLFEGDANDTSGNEKHGSVIDAVPSADRFGVAGKAYEFDGNDYIQLPAGDSIISDASSSYTISVWFKTNSAVNNPVIISAYNRSGTEEIFPVHCYINPGLGKNKIYNGLCYLSYGYFSENYDSVSDGLWHHLVLVNDSVTLKHHVYVDDRLASSVSITKQDFIDSGVVRVGACYNGVVSNYFIGSLDDVRIYNKALIPGEITALFHENAWQDKVAKPVFNKSGGVYSGAQSVEISCATDGAEIRYTTDGSEPTETSALYGGAITVPAVSQMTIKAKAYKSGCITSFLETCKFTTVSGYVIQPGPIEGKDTYISSFYNLDYSRDEKLTNGGWGDEYNSLIYFDVSGAPASPVSAKLYLYTIDYNDSSTPCGMYLDSITSSWDQATVRWPTRPLYSNVSTIPASTKGQWYVIDITGLYNNWKASPSTNYGILLRPTATSNNFNRFYSSRFMDDTSLRPYLIVE